MLRLVASVAVLSMAPALLLATPALAADGAQVFNMQCKFCHSGSPVGPNLAGVAGRKIGGTEFAYSPGIKEKGEAGETWTDQNLDAFLKSPPAFAPGGKMFTAVPDDANRAAVIEYLKSLSAPAPADAPAPVPTPAATPSPSPGGR